MLTGKSAVVTGANRGIGRATVEKLAQNGAGIFACARCETIEFVEDMKALAEKYSVSIMPVFFDLLDEQQVKNGVEAIRKTRKTIDILVNNAGIIPKSHTFFMMEMESMRQVLENNAIMPLMLTQYISRIMMRQKSGSIINIASVAALDGEPAEMEYAVSKGALVAATKKLAIELGAYGIRVNAIAPGLVQTEMGNQLNQQEEKRILERVIMRRKGTPEEIADSILFLASNCSSYITGQVIRVDGGMI